MAAPGAAILIINNFTLILYYVGLYTFQIVTWFFN